MLQVNGITGAEAEEMFRRARGERIAFLRGEGVRRVIKGSLLLAGGIGLFCDFWLGFRAITFRIFVICGLLGAWGLWWLVDGAVNAFCASARKGSVTPESY
jgi:hypothetical protein